LRDQVRQSARRKNQHQASRDCESVEVPMFRREQN
jgi:hypothetical protein